MKSGPRGRIYSVYFAPDEETLIRAIAKRNGTSLSMVVRVGVRVLANWPHPPLEVPPEQQGHPPATEIDT